jgi:hypothetical protein
VTKLVKIQTVDSMTSRVDCFRLKTIRSLVTWFCGFNESSILLLHYPILLWSVWDREFMTNAFFIRILLMLVFLNSVPLSLLTHLIFTSNSFWALVANFLNIS